MVLLCGNRPEFAAPTPPRTARGLRLTAVNWHLTAEETAYIAADCEATAIVADVELADVATAVAGADAVAHHAHRRRAAHRGLRPVGRRAGAYDGVEHRPDPVLGSSMLYTSGTTGRPKGVFRKTAVRPARGRQAVYDYRDGDRHLCTGPLYHAAPLAFSLAIPLMNGVGRHAHDALDRPRTRCASSRPTGSPTPTWSRPCSTGCSRCPTRCATATTCPRCASCCTARRRARSPVKQADDGVVGPGGARVLRRDRGRGHVRSTARRGSSTRAASVRR